MQQQQQQWSGQAAAWDRRSREVHNMHPDGLHHHHKCTCCLQGNLAGTRNHRAVAVSKALQAQAGSH